MTVYHVVLRHRDDHTQLCEWHERDGHVMSYPDARDVLLEQQRLHPGLHLPGQGYYLAAEPIRAGA